MTAENHGPWRLSWLTDGAGKASYSYLDHSDLVRQIELKQYLASRMTTTAVHDNLNRLSSVTSLASGGALASSGYQYNDASQRTRQTLADGAYWLYQYDPLGQVQSGKKYWADGGLAPGGQFEYTQDDIGNRTQTQVGGDASGTGLRPASYSVNNLNQYSQRTNPTSVDVVGVASTAASVSVWINGASASVYRRGEYFQAVGGAGNGSGPAWTPVSVAASRGGELVQQPASAPGHLIVPPATQGFTFDADGNLLSDGVWNYTWDAENRLIAQEMSTSLPVAARQRLEFTYDWQGRRIRKLVKNSSLQILSDTRFVYDG